MMRQLLACLLIGGAIMLGIRFMAKSRDHTHEPQYECTPECRP